MAYETENGYRRILYFLLWGVLLAVGGGLFFFFLWKPLLPFVFALLLAVLLRKPLAVLDKLTHGKRGARVFWGVLLVLLSAGLLLYLLFFLSDRLLTEGKNLIATLLDRLPSLEASVETLLASAEQWFERFASPQETWLSTVFSSARDLLANAIGEMLSALAAGVPSVLGALVAALPRLFLGIAVFLIAAVYLTLDLDRINRFLTEKFPSKTAKVLETLKSSFVATVVLYGKAYGFLLLVTFAELAVGFSVLGISYALTTAAVTAVIDLLPVFGTGTVLLPWAVFLFFGGDVLRGTGLILLYVLITVIRQIIEPKIIGRHIGIHPLLALLTMYLGFRLFGLFGLFLCPMGAAVLMRCLEARDATGRKTEAKAV